MQVQAFRVSEVLRGHTAIAAVVGQDAGGRTLRLEVPAAEAAAIGSGDVLVIGWARVEVPAAAMAADRSVPSSAATAASMASMASPSEIGSGRFDEVDGQAAIVDAVFTASSGAMTMASPAAASTAQQVGASAGTAPESLGRSAAAPVDASTGTTLAGLARTAESEFRRLFGVR